MLLVLLHKAYKEINLKLYLLKIYGQPYMVRTAYLIRNIYYI